MSLFYIVGKISDKSILESGFRSPFNLTDFRNAIANNHGGVYTDYYVYSIDEILPDAIRVKTGDEFTAVWTGDQITGISFEIEDNKKWINTTIDRSTFMADNKEQILINVSILKYDKSGIDDTFSETLDIPIKSPDKVYKIRFRFINGKASRSIKTDVPGSWILPQQIISGYRNNNKVTFDSIQ